MRSQRIEGMIVIPAETLADMVAHAREEAPNEACGLLAGVESTVGRSFRLTNVDASPEHFSLDVREQFAAVKEMRAAGLEMLAVYHSHPVTPARMSVEDLRLAFTPGIAYVIVSLANPDQPVVKSFRIVDGSPIEEQVSIQE